MDDVREQVRQRYALAAVQTTDDGCCGGSCGPHRVDESFGQALYDATESPASPSRRSPRRSAAATPSRSRSSRAGERVLDLGSGGGIDVLLSARRVGPTGFAYGVDMTDEMLELARANAAKAGATNVEFRKGTIEELPFADGSVDVVISNCVVNLSPDKSAVLGEVFRVLADGGRVGISDVVAEDHLTPEQRAERGSYVGCIAGALSRAEYLDRPGRRRVRRHGRHLHPPGRRRHARRRRPRPQARQGGLMHPDLVLRRPPAARARARREAASAARRRGARDSEDRGAPRPRLTRFVSWVQAARPAPRPAPVCCPA